MTADRYCLACDKPGHLTTECHSTHGMSTPADRELFRLIQAAKGSQSPAEGDEALYLLHCGQIDSSGEQDEWDIQADSYKRVEEFCRLHPGQTVKLYPHVQPKGTATDWTDEQINAAWGRYDQGYDTRRALIGRILAAAQSPAPGAVPPENLPTKEHIRELAQEALDQIMEQAQVFASAWSLVGGRFDYGNALSEAHDAKDELRTMVRSLADLAAETVRPAQCAAVTHAEPAADQPGPRTLSVEKTCQGCPQLKTESWTEYLENDETDHGTSATCGLNGERISNYWHKGDPPPRWCPAASHVPVQPMGEANG